MLRLAVLGGMAVDIDGTAVDAPPARRPWSLLAYLALHPGRHARGDLAACFWPEVLDASSRASLRSAVWALRRELGPAADGLLVADRDSIGLADQGIWIDAAQFARLVDAGELEAAVELCRGPLLAGFDDEWVIRAREEHNERLLAVLERLAASADRVGDDQGALLWTRRQVAIDPYGEEAHRRLIARLAERGDRAAALVLYRTLADRLRRELGVAPSPATQQLIRDLRSDDSDGATPHHDGIDASRSLRPARRETPPLLGREQELATLEGVWSDVVHGRGALASIRGPAGIGKSRLAAALLARAEATGARTAACAGLDLGGGAPFVLWAELVRDLARDLPSPPLGRGWPNDLARLAPDAGLAAVPAEDTATLAPELQRARLFEAAVSLIEWASQDRPLMLLVEDVHGADEASLQLLGYVARRIAQLPVLIVLTRRTPPRRAGVDRLELALRARELLAGEVELGSLPPSALAALARSVAELPEEQVSEVVDVCEGNPLLATQAARSIARGEDPAAGLGATARAAVALCGEDARSLVAFAAVAARDLERDELLSLPLDEPARAAAEAIDGGLLRGERGRVGFVHALLRDAVYAELSEPLRTDLHGRWAHALLACERAGGRRRPAEVARHLRIAAEPRAAADELARAAVDARSLGALSEAAGYLREAIELIGDRADLWIELGEIEAWRGDRAAAEAAFAHARQALAPDQREGLARAWLRRAGWYHGSLCVPALVGASCREALALLGDDPACASERREALAALAWAEAIAGDPDESERLLAELALLASSGGGDDLATYDIGHARAWALMRRGRFREAYAPSIAAGEAIARAGRPDLAYGCWSNVTGAAAAARDFARAFEFAERGRDALAGHGLLGIEVNQLSERVFLLLRTGRVDEARAVVAAEQALAERLDQPRLLALATADAGLVELADGRHERAATLLAAVLDAADAPVSRPLIRLARAEALARARRPEDAAAELRETVLEPVAPSDFPATLVCRLTRVEGLIAAARGDREEALARLREAAEGWRREQPSAAADGIAAVLADLGRPLVGLVDPEHEHARVLADIAALTTDDEGIDHAIVH